MKHTKTPIYIEPESQSDDEHTRVFDANDLLVARVEDGNEANEILHAVNTHEALAKSHAELLAALGEIVNIETNAKTLRKWAADAIANAQPVVTMLRKGK